MSTEKPLANKAWSRCTGLTLAGKPCRSAAGSDTLCAQHSPRFSTEQRSAWGLRGAATIHGAIATKALAKLPTVDQLGLTVPDLSDDAAVQRYIVTLLAKIEAGMLPPSLAKAITALIEVRLKLVELSTNSKLGEIEALLKLKGLRGGPR